MSSQAGLQPSRLGSYPPVTTPSTQQRPIPSSLSIDTASLAPSTSNLSFGSSMFTDSPAVDSARHSHRPYMPHAELPFPSMPTSSGVETKTTSVASASTAASSRLFQQLEVIKSLQGDIAKQHARLEGISSASGDGDGDGDWVWAVKGTKGVKTGEESKPVGEMDDKGNRKDGEMEERATTAKAYDSMAAEFAKRQAGVSDMMSTVSTSSTGRRARRAHQQHAAALHPLNCAQDLSRPPIPGPLPAIYAPALASSPAGPLLGRWASRDCAG